MKSLILRRPSPCSISMEMVRALLGAVRTEVSCLAEEGTRRKQQEEEVPEATSQEIDASVLQYRDCASGIF